MSHLWEKENAGVGGEENEKKGRREKGNRKGGKEARREEGIKIGGKIRRNFNKN